MTAIIAPGSGILGQTAQIWRLEPSRTHGDVACFDGPFCRLVAGLSDQDENGDNQLLFLEIKMFWLFEPVEESGGQMVVRKKRNEHVPPHTCRPIRSLKDSALCLRSFLASAKTSQFF